MERSQNASDAATTGSLENSRGLLKARGTAGRAEKESLKLTEAAQEFEALLLGQMLKMVREAGSGGWLGSGESRELSSTMELAETQLARALAQSGALGITKLLAGELPPDSPRQAGVRQPESVVESGAASLERGGR